MEVDKGAAVTLIPQSLQTVLFPKAQLVKPMLTLCTYKAQHINVVGEMSVQVKYGGYVGQQQLYIVKGRGPSLLGRDWLSHIRLDWASIKLLAKEGTPAVSELVEEYAEVFKEGLGTMSHNYATLSLKEGSAPRFHHLHPVPFALREAVGKELDHLEETGILRRVHHSDWANPIIPVPKRDGAIRL